jgi:pilus assembly protein Flp/PilA
MLTYSYVVVMNYLASFKREEGQGMVEYALIIGLIAVALVVGLGLLQVDIDAAFTKITTALPN